jgi:pectin methylesterase-like acyl-CoA thioesterase
MTFVVYNNSAYTEKPDGSGTYGTSGSATVTLKAADFTAMDLTFSNDFDESSTTNSNKQAVAVKTSGDRIVFNNVHLIGNQDTLYADSGSNITIARVYFYNCYIEGDVDFIFGRATAVFDRTRIHALNRDLNPSGYLTAPSTWIENPYGFLIVNSNVTSDAANKTGYLGRPWHPSGNVNSIGMTIIRETELPASIMDTAWSDMSGFSWEEARFYEYSNTGPGAVINDNRPQLTEEQATVYTAENFLAGSDNWNPIVD